MSKSKCTHRLLVTLALIVTATQELICYDYNGKNREVYKTGATIEAVEVLNDIAYYAISNPIRYRSSSYLFIHIFNIFIIKSTRDRAIV